MIGVLIVDDHELFRTALRARLDAEGDITTVGCTGTARQAVALARTLRPDVILLDLVLPDGAGSKAIPALLAANPATSIIAVSSQTQPGVVRRSIAAGARGYVPKRASDTELIEAIRRVASGDRYVDPALGAELVVGDAVPALQPISDREREVLHLLALGHTNQEISDMLFVSVRTVDTHRAHIMRKLDLQTRADLVLFALANGLIGAV
ncbi:response regulator [Jatrophihabitans sp. DSM 45814]